MCSVPHGLIFIEKQEDIMVEYVTRLKDLGYTQDEANCKYAYHLSVGSFDVLENFLNIKEACIEID